MKKKRATSFLALLGLLSVARTVALPRPDNPSPRHVRSDDPSPLQALVEQQAAQLSALQAKVTANQADLQAKVAALANDLGAKLVASQKQIHDLQITQRQQVAFTATIVESSSPASLHSPIPFHRVVSNVGSAFDPHTSIFTAPFTGQYMLFVTVDVSKDYRGLNIVKNGSTLFIGHNDGDDHHIVAGGAVTLNQGDKVWVRHGVATGLVDGGAEAVFSGFKI